MQHPSHICCLHHKARSPTQWVRSGIETASSWKLVRFVSAVPQWKLPFSFATFPALVPPFWEIRLYLFINIRVCVCVCVCVCCWAKLGDKAEKTWLQEDSHSWWKIIGPVSIQDRNQPPGTAFFSTDKRDFTDLTWSEEERCERDILHQVDGSEDELPSQTYSPPE